MLARMLRLKTLVRCGWNVKGAAAVENGAVAPHKNKQNCLGPCVALSVSTSNPGKRGADTCTPTPVAAHTGSHPDGHRRVSASRPRKWDILTVTRSGAPHRLQHGWALQTLPE